MFITLYSNFAQAASTYSITIIINNNVNAINQIESNVAEDNKIKNRRNLFRSKRKEDNDIQGKPIKNIKTLFKLKKKEDNNINDEPIKVIRYLL